MSLLNARMRIVIILPIEFISVTSRKLCLEYCDFSFKFQESILEIATIDKCQLDLKNNHLDIGN